jgi:hypothetical protein
LVERVKNKLAHEEEEVINIDTSPTHTYYKVCVVDLLHVKGK